MANSSRSWWQRTRAALTGREPDERTDAKVLIQQAVEDHQRSHQRLVQAAAGVIQKSRIIEMRLSSAMSGVDRLRETVREAGERVEEARAAGDAARVAALRENVRSLADRLMAAEHERDELRIMFDDANVNSAEVRRRVERHAARLQRVLADRTRLLGQLDQASAQRALGAEAGSPVGPGGRGAGEVTASRTELQRRYAAALRVAGQAAGDAPGRVTTPRLEELRAARAAAAEDPPA